MAEHFHKPKPEIQPIEEVQPRRNVEKTQEADQIASSEKISFEQTYQKVDPSKAKVELRPKETEAEIKKDKSLLDIAREAKSISGTPSVPTQDSLKNQAFDLKQQITKPRATLLSYESKGIDIPAEFAKDMGKPLEHIDKALSEAQHLAGVEAAASLADKVHNPTVKFLHYLTDADKRLDTVLEEVGALTAKGKKLTPEKLLAVQLKINFVQQQLEFFTNILNRSVESIKTLMNIQI